MPTCQVKVGAFLILAAATTVLAIAYAGAGTVSAPPIPQAAPTVAPLSPDPAVGAGERLYYSKGCVDCHGANLEFLVVVNLPEISETAVMRQVRSPTGMMRSFSAAEISDEELREVARFIVGVLSQRSQPRP